MVPQSDNTLQAYHTGCRVWVPTEELKGSGAKAMVLYGRQGLSGWVEGYVTKVVEGADGSGSLDVQAEDGRLLTGLSAGSCPLQNEQNDIVEDLVDSDFLHEPG